MRSARVSHAVFALTMAAFGVVGLVKGDFAQLWQPVPKYVPAHTALAYLCGLVVLACGIGILWRRSSALASRVLLGLFALWFVLVRAPYILVAPNVSAWYSDCEFAVMLAAAWTLFVWFAPDGEARWLVFATGERGLRIARVLYGLALIPFGLAHFLYLENTAPLVPSWLPWHELWAYLTGTAFIAAGVAIVADVWGRLAATLSVVQVGMFFVLVWIPLWAAGKLTPFQQGEVITTWAIAVAGWVVADAYRGVAWGALRRGTPAPGLR